MPSPLLTLHNAHVTFGGKPLFEDITLTINEGDKISLVGKNGAGKSTLFSIITGERELDGGKRWTPPGLKIGYLPQQIQPEKNKSVRDYVMAGLTKDEQNEDFHYLADIVLSPLDLDADRQMEHLSGGQLRRASLARALITAPDILLLDEPTNHLDLSAIEWLESYLQGWRGALVVISHDRTFLNNISSKVFWLDRGEIRISGQGYKYFDEWSLALLEQEERELHNLSKKIEAEHGWTQGGVTARRKRNVRRLRQLQEMRVQLKTDTALFRQTMNTVKLDPLAPVLASKVVAEFHDVSHAYGDLKILDHFNLRVMRGDRVGIIGKNGSGKTTFLKMITGNLQPDMGRIKLAKNLEFSYFDQKREHLDPAKTLWDTLCPTGGDQVKVGEGTRHVVGYLKQWLFDPKIAKTPVGALSGGQANRLLMAKMLANPAPFMIMDEPTNDLDMDTLDMLQEMLSSFPGTLFIVSHDRDFLDRTITKLLAFEGDGKVEGHIGGYSDYIEAKKALQKPQIVEKLKKDQEKKPESKPITFKPTFKIKHEWESLPKRIETLQIELSELEKKLADAEFYISDKDGFHQSTECYEALKSELSKAETRWLELADLFGE